MKQRLFLIPLLCLVVSGQADQEIVPDEATANSITCQTTQRTEVADNDEAVSLLQVGARRIEKMATTAAGAVSGGPKHANAATSAAAAMPWYGKVPGSSGFSLVAMQVGLMEAHRQGLEGLQQMATPMSAVILMAAAALVSLLCLVACCCDFGLRSRNQSSVPNIAQHFPRAGPYSKPFASNPFGPFVSPGDPDGALTFRPSFQPASSMQPPGGRQHLLSSSSVSSLSPPSGGEHRPALARISMSSYVSQQPHARHLSAAPGSWVQPPSRPSTALGITPANSIRPSSVRELPPQTSTTPPEMTVSSLKRPPPLCPMLVLPHCESFFAIPIDKLLSGANTGEILGLSGNALLRINIKGGADDRVPRIEVCMAPPRSPALASISCPNNAAHPNVSPCGAMLELTGSRGKHYGWLRPSGTGYYVLQCGRDDVMTVSSRKGGHCQLISSHGDLLAEASRSGDGEHIFAPEDFEVRVMPGMDAVLAVLCVVSTILAPSSPRPTHASAPAPRF